LGDEQEHTLGEFVEDEDAPLPEDAAAKALCRESVQRALSSLSPRQRGVLALRYGLEDGDSRTLAETGRKIGVSRERVRQIEQKALGRLRESSHYSTLRECFH
jgi:RNA polymerase primary sigma factor